VQAMSFVVHIPLVAFAISFLALVPAAFRQAA
jgi:hypothetical protein